VGEVAHDESESEEEWQTSGSAGGVAEVAIEAIALGDRLTLNLDLMALTSPVLESDGAESLSAAARVPGEPARRHQRVHFFEERGRVDSDQSELLHPTPVSFALNIAELSRASAPEAVAEAELGGLQPDTAASQAADTAHGARGTFDRAQEHDDEQGEAAGGDGGAAARGHAASQAEDSPGLILGPSGRSNSVGRWVGRGHDWNPQSTQRGGRGTRPAPSASARAWTDPPRTVAVVGQQQLARMSTTEDPARKLLMTKEMCLHWRQSDGDRWLYCLFRRLNNRGALRMIFKPTMGPDGDQCRSL
jgi:hypothetical protein